MYLITFQILYCKRYNASNEYPMSVAVPWFGQIVVYVQIKMAAD